MSYLVPKAPRMRCMLFSAHAAKHVLSLPDGAILDKVDRWGVLDHTEKVRSSWTEELDILYVGKRSPAADEWRRRHHVGRSVHQAPQGELDAFLPDMAADHRWNHVQQGTANGHGVATAAIWVLQIVAAGAVLLNVIVAVGYTFGACDPNRRAKSEVRTAWDSQQRTTLA